MNVKDIIEKVDYLKPNDYTEEDKIMWLKTIEAKIWQEIILTHVKPDGLHMYPLDLDSTPFAIKYSENENQFVDLYVYYLMAMIDKSNEEIERYINQIALFNNEYQLFSNYWHNKYMPIYKGQFII